MTTLDWAIKYQRLGWSIIPVQPKAKLPAVEWKLYQSIPATLEQIKTWFTSSDYGIGLVTGKRSGVAVIDCEADDNWSDLSSPLISQTGTGGRHYFFKYDGVVRNSVRLDGKPRDIRGEGGYVLLPPSIHPNGKPYLWIAKNISKIDQLPTFPESQAKRQEFRNLDWGEVAKVFEGGRNDSAARVAGSILRRFPSDQWELIGWEALKAWNLKSCEPPLNEMELRTTWESIKQRQLSDQSDKHPRDVAKSIPNARKNLADLIKTTQPTERFLTGFSQIDISTKGLRPANAYLLGGLEKSGKSALLMNIMNKMLIRGQKIGYFSSELMAIEFSDRMAAIHFDRPIAEVETDPTLRQKWFDKFSGLLEYAGLDDESLKENNILSFDKTLSRLSEFVASGAKCIIVDNLTTWNSQASSDGKGWEILSGCISKLVQFAKQKNVVVIFVIHVKPEVVYSETPEGIRVIAKSDNPRDVFKESLTVSRRPSLANVYGGGGALSQISGAFLLWRPFQKYDEPRLKNLAMLILDSQRHSESGVDIEMTFNGTKGIFTESSGDDSISRHSGISTEASEEDQNDLSSTLPF